MPFVEIHFAGQNHSVATDAQTFERTADVRFGGAERIAVGGVDEIDAAVDGMADDAFGGILVDGPLVEIRGCLAEAHTAEADLGDLNAGPSQRRVSHVYHIVLLCL